MNYGIQQAIQDVQEVSNVLNIPPEAAAYVVMAGALNELQATLQHLVGQQHHKGMDGLSGG